MAIVKLPYLYRVRGVAPGQRASKVHRVLDFVMVDVPELSSKEVPVGFEVHARLKKNRTILLSHGGRPVSAMKLPGIGQFGETEGPVTADTLRDWVDRIEGRAEQVSWNSYPLPFDREYDGVLSHQYFADEAMRRVDKSYQEEDRAKAMRVASGMIFVGGALHAPAAEIRHQVQFMDTRGSEWVDVSLVTGKDAIWETFRYDRRDEMMAFIEATTEQRHAVHVYEAEVTDHGGIVWQHDDASESTHNVAQLVMIHLGTDAQDLRFMSGDFYQALCEVRENWRNSSTRQDMLPALERMQTALEESSEDPHCRSLVRSLSALLRRPLIRQRQFEAPLHDASTDLEGFSIEP